MSQWTYWKPVHYKHSSQTMHLLHSTSIHILSLLKFNLYLFHTYFWEVSWNKRYIFQRSAYFLKHCGFPHGKHVLSATVIELKTKKNRLLSWNYLFLQGICLIANKIWFQTCIHHSRLTCLTFWLLALKFLQILCMF